MKNTVDKAVSRGVESLNDGELLALLLEDKPLSEKLMELCSGTIETLSHNEIARLRMMGGMGLKAALRILSAVEFGRRVVNAKAADACVVTTSEDVVRLFKTQLERLPHEECWAIYLTTSNRVVERQRISQGGVQGTVVDHRLVVKRALELLATQLIMVHNHPSGAAEPSQQDKLLTEKIAQATALFDIRLLDHIIISREGDFSFRSAGLLH